MHPVVAAIRTLLEKNTVPYRYLEHAPGKTSAEMAEIRKDYTIREGAKALILSTEKGFIQVVVPGDRKFSNAGVKKAAEVKEIRFATEEELSRITDGVVPGAVPPFGGMFNLPVYADKRLFENRQIVFNCGERTASIAMNPEDYRKIVGPTVADITGN